MTGMAIRLLALTPTRQRYAEVATNGWREAEFLCFTVRIAIVDAGSSCIQQPLLVEGIA
jgi:hypothetical protein